MSQNPVTPEIGMEKPILSPISGNLWCGGGFALNERWRYLQQIPSFSAFAFFLVLLEFLLLFARLMVCIFQKFYMLLFVI